MGKREIRSVPVIDNAAATAAGQLHLLRESGPLLIGLLCRRFFEFEAVAAHHQIIDRQVFGAAMDFQGEPVGEPDRKEPGFTLLII